MRKTTPQGVSTLCDIKAEPGGLDDDRRRPISKVAPEFVMPHTRTPGAAGGKVRNQARRLPSCRRDRARL